MPIAKIRIEEAEKLYKKAKDLLKSQEEDMAKVFTIELYGQSFDISKMISDLMEKDLDCNWKVATELAIAYLEGVKKEVKLKSKSGETPLILIDASYQILKEDVGPANELIEKVNKEEIEHYQKLKDHERYERFNNFERLRAELLMQPQPMQQVGQQEQVIEQATDLEKLEGDDAKLRDKYWDEIKKQEGIPYGSRAKKKLCGDTHRLLTRMQVRKFSHLIHREVFIFLRLYNKDLILGHEIIGDDSLNQLRLTIPL